MLVMQRTRWWVCPRCWRMKSKYVSVRCPQASCSCEIILRIEKRNDGQTAPQYWQEVWRQKWTEHFHSSPCFRNKIVLSSDMRGLTEQSSWRCRWIVGLVEMWWRSKEAPCCDDKALTRQIKWETYSVLKAVRPENVPGSIIVSWFWLIILHIWHQMTLISFSVCQTSSAEPLDPKTGLQAIVSNYCSKDFCWKIDGYIDCRGYSNEDNAAEILEMI